MHDPPGTSACLTSREAYLSFGSGVVSGISLRRHDWLNVIGSVCSPRPSQELGLIPLSSETQLLTVWLSFPARLLPSSGPPRWFNKENNKTFLSLRKFQEFRGCLPEPGTEATQIIYYRALTLNGSWVGQEFLGWQEAKPPQKHSIWLPQYPAHSFIFLAVRKAWRPPPELFHNP